MTNKERVNMHQLYHQNSNHEQNIGTIMRKYTMAKGRNGDAN
jgi:hypothetical protein